MTHQLNHRMCGKTSLPNSCVFTWRVNTAITPTLRLSLWENLLAPNHSSHKVTVVNHFMETVNPGQWNPWVRWIPAGEEE